MREARRAKENERGTQNYLYRQRTGCALLLVAKDGAMRAEILSYSRARGLFAGISLEGSTLRPDNDGNERLYDKGTTSKDVVINSAIYAPASARLLVSTLNKEVSEKHV